MYYPYPVHDPDLALNLDYISQNAIQGDQANMMVQGTNTGSPETITISTAGTAVQENINFPTPYASVPRVQVTIIGCANANTWMWAGALSITKTGFALTANSSAAQQLTINWEANGPMGGD